MQNEKWQAVTDSLVEGKDGEPTLNTSGASPGESPYYNRIFMASFKGQSRGAWGGVLLGGGLGAVAGVAVAAVTAALMPAAVTFAAVVMPVVAITTMGGMLYGKDVFSTSGAVAGAVAAGMEIAEERRHSEELLKVNGVGQGAASVAPLSSMPVGNVVQVAAPTSIMSDYKKVGHMAAGEIAYTGNEQFTLFGEKHHDIDERPLYFGKVGVAGAAIGALFAGVVAYTGGGLVEGLEHSEMFGHLVDKLGLAGDAATTTALAQTVVTASGAAAGATYGINRHYFRNVFNVSNALYDGNLDEIGKQQAQQQDIELLRVQTVEKIHDQANDAPPLPKAIAVTSGPIGAVQVVSDSTKAQAGGAVEAARGKVDAGLPSKQVSVKDAVLAEMQVAQGKDATAQHIS